MIQQQWRCTGVKGVKVRETVIKEHRKVSEKKMKIQLAARVSENTNFLLWLCFLNKPGAMS